LFQTEARNQCSTFAFRHDDKNDKWLASMNTTKEALKAAPEFKYPK